MIKLNLPNKLTLIRIFLIPLLMVFLISSSRVDEVIAAFIFIAASITDWLDGHIARRTHQVTTLGKLLDPIADKILISAAFISLVQVNRVPAWMVVVIIGREFAVTGLRGIAASAGIIIPASTLGKSKMACQVFAIIFLILDGSFSLMVPFIKMKLSLFLTWIALLATLISGIDYFIKLLTKMGFEDLTRKRER